MKYVWVFVIGLPILFIATYMSIENKKQVLEKFGVFGDSAIPYDQLIKDTYTPKELPEFQALWNKMHTSNKNNTINEWNSRTPKDQNEYLKRVKSERDARQKIENI